MRHPWSWTKFHKGVRSRGKSLLYRLYEHQFAAETPSVTPCVKIDSNPGVACGVRLDSGKPRRQGPSHDETAGNSMGLLTPTVRDSDRPPALQPTARPGVRRDPAEPPESV